MAPETFAERMERSGYTTGFDYLRIGLAAAVVLWHSVAASGDAVARAVALGPIVGPFQWLILPMFFALSGFLVSGSLHRSRTITGFVTLRVLRLMPALSVEVLLSALFIGPLLTTKTFYQYFSDPEFFRYFWNIVGHIHFELPGVFDDNPMAGIVNISLWTVPYELECYLAIVGFAVFGIFARPKLFAATTLFLTVALTALILYKISGDGMTGGRNGRMLVLAFLWGSTIYLFKNYIPLSKWLALVSLLSIFTLYPLPETRALGVIPAAYLTVFLGLQTPKKIIGGDYSYGVYLFAFPIQQYIASLHSLRYWWIIFLIALPLSICYAAFSWHCIEKPILDRKNSMVNLIEILISRLRSRFTPVAPGVHTSNKVSSTES